MRKTRKQMKLKGGVGSFDILYTKVDSLMEKIEVLKEDPIYDDLQLIGQSFRGLHDIPPKDKITFLQDFNHGTKYKDIRLYIEKSYFPENVKKLKESISSAGFQDLAQEIRQTMEPVVEHESHTDVASAATEPEKPKKKKKTATQALVEVFAGRTRSKATETIKVAVKASNRSLGLKLPKHRKSRKQRK